MRKTALLSLAVVLGLLSAAPGYGDVTLFGTQEFRATNTGGHSFTASVPGGTQLMVVSFLGRNNAFRYISDTSGMEDLNITYVHFDQDQPTQQDMVLIDYEQLDEGVDLAGYANDIQAAMYYLVNPPSGSHTCRVQYNGGITTTAAIISYYGGVNTLAPIGASDAVSAVTGDIQVSLNHPRAGTRGIDGVVANNNDVGAPNGNATQIYNFTMTGGGLFGNDQNRVRASASAPAGAGSQLYSYPTGGARCALVAAVVMPNSPPTDITGALSVDSDTSNGAPVGTLAVVDPDNGPTPFTWTLLNSAGGRFALQGTTGDTIDVVVADSGLIDDSVSEYPIQVRVADAAGQTFTKTLFVTVDDITPPSVAIGIPSLSVVDQATPVSFLVYYGGASSVTLSPADISIAHSGGSSGGNITVLGTGNELRTIQIVGLQGTGSFTISIAPGTATDGLNSAPGAGPSQVVGVNNTDVTITLGAPSLTLVNQSTATQFLVSYTGATNITLDGGDITLNHSGTTGGVANIIVVSPFQRAISVSGVQGNGSFTVSIAAGTADNGVLFASAAGPSAPVTVDNTGVDIAWANFSPTIVNATTPFTFDVWYAGATSVTLSSSNIQIFHGGSSSGGDVTVFNVGASERLVRITGFQGDGVFVVNIPAGTATDGVNLAPGRGPSPVIVVDNTPPSVTLGAPSATIVNSSATVTIDVTYEDAETVDLGVADVTLDTTGNVTGDVAVLNGTTLTPQIVLTNLQGEGTARVVLAPGASVDLAGNADLGPAGPSGVITVKNTPPSVLLGPADQSIVNVSMTVNIPVTYTGATSVNLTQANVHIVPLAGKALGDGTVAVLNGTTATPTIRLTNLDGNGFVSVVVDPGTSQDGAGNLDAGAELDPPIQVRNAAPTLVIGPPSMTVVNRNAIVTFGVTYEGAFSVNLLSADVSLQVLDGSVSGDVTIVDGSTDTPEIQISNLEGDGSFAISIAPGTSQNPGGLSDAGAGPSDAVTVDNTAPTITANDVTTLLASPALSGMVNDPAASIDVTLASGSFTAQNLGEMAWALPVDIITPLSLGDHQFTAVATDEAMNVASAVGTIHVVETLPSTLPAAGLAGLVVVALGILGATSRVGKGRRLRSLILLAALGLAITGTASAQPCYQAQLDYDFRLGTLERLLGELLVSPTTGENLWIGNMGSTPVWNRIPTQQGPGFLNLDNTGNGIDDDDHFDLLAAVMNGAPSVVAGLPPANVTAIRNAYNANRAYLQTLEITLRNVHLNNLPLIGNITRDVTTGGTIDIPVVGAQDVPSLWSINEGGEEGILASADPRLEALLIDLGTAVMTIGDPADIDWFQALVAQLTVSVIENLVPTLLADLKSAAPGAAGALAAPPDLGGEKAYTVPCGLISDINQHISASGIEGDLFVDNVDICNAVQTFINQFVCGAGFSCQTSLLAASGNLNSSGATNLASYNAAATRQAWMIAESLTNPPLQITVQPTSQTIETGASFSVTTASVPGLPAGPVQYNWQRINPEDYSPLADLTSSATYSVALATLGDNGSYAAYVCDPLWTRRTLPANIVVNKTSFRVVTQPVGNLNLFVGGSYSLSVGVRGGESPYSYQWYYGPTAASQTTLVGTTNPLVLSNLQLSNTGYYRCLITDVSAPPATISSTTVQLRVLPPPIVIDDAGLFGANLITGEGHNFLISASGGLGTLNYQWRFNPGTGAVTVGTNSPSYTVTGATSNQQGTYRCLVTDGSGQQASSKFVTLTVLGIGTAPPANVSFALNDTVSVPVLPVGGNVAVPNNPTSYTYQWYFDDGLGGGFVSMGAGQQTNALTIPNAQTTDSGQYRVDISDGTPRTVSAFTTVTVTANPVVISQSPVSGGRLAGQSKLFTVAASGGNPIPDDLEFTWFFDDGSGPVQIFNIGDYAILSSNTYSELTVSNLTTAAHQGEYFCRVQDKGTPQQTQDSAVAELTVGTALTLDSQPVGGDFYAGDIHSPALSVATSGGIGEITYSWYRTGDPTAIQEGPNDTLDLSPLDLSHAGSYYCRVKDVGTGDGALSNYTPTGQFTSQTAVIRVGEPLTPDPAVTPESQHVRINDSATFSVSVSGGLGQLDYRWYKAGSGGGTPLSTTAQLVLTQIAPEDAGGYYCEIRDEIGVGGGFVTSAFGELTVAEPLIVTVTPTNLTVDEGLNAELLAAPAGGLTNTYTYEWRRVDGRALSNNVTGGFSDRLVFTGLTELNTGEYYCIARDSGESATSNAALLHVRTATEGLPVAGPAGLLLLAAAAALGGALRLRRK